MQKNSTGISFNSPTIYRTAIYVQCIAVYTQFPEYLMFPEFASLG